MTRLILASGSPRRKSLLQAAGYVFDVCCPDVVELLKESEAPEDYVMRNAQLKARWALEREVRLKNNSVVLAGDTVVVHRGDVLEKPRDEVDARQMLQLLSGQQHVVISGVAILETKSDLLAASREEIFFVATEVQFKQLSERELDWYLATNEPLDKAGAYGAQGHGAFLVAGVLGSYTNVVGLPMAEVTTLLASHFNVFAGE